MMPQPRPPEMFMLYIIHFWLVNVASPIWREELYHQNTRYMTVVLSTWLMVDAFLQFIQTTNQEYKTLESIWDYTAKI